MKWLTWLRSLTVEKSVTGWRELSQAYPDDPGLFHPDGRSRLARVSRYPTPDAEKLRLLKHKADVIRLDSRRQMR